jgi:hypothetical protein
MNHHSLFIVHPLRATRDFDFIIHLEPKNIDRFILHFKDGYYCDKDAIQDAVNRRSMFNIIDHASGFKADFVVLKNEAYKTFNRHSKWRISKILLLLNSWIGLISQNGSIN